MTLISSYEINKHPRKHLKTNIELQNGGLKKAQLTRTTNKQRNKQTKKQRNKETKEQRNKEKNKQTNKHRQTTNNHRQTNKQASKQTQTNRQTDRQTNKHRQTDRQTDKKTNKQTQTDRQTNKQTQTNKHRQTDKQTQTDRQTGRQTNKQTDKTDTRFFPLTFLGVLSDPFRLSDFHLGNQKVTRKKLACVIYVYKWFRFVSGIHFLNQLVSNWALNDDGA